jgi:hypothetical protein
LGDDHEILIRNDRNVVDVAKHAAIVAKAEHVLASSCEVGVRPAYISRRAQTIGGAWG